MLFVQNFFLKFFPKKVPGNRIAIFLNLNQCIIKYLKKVSYQNDYRNKDLIQKFNLYSSRICYYSIYIYSWQYKKEVGNGDTYYKATFVKINLQFGCMVLWWPSYFVLNDFHPSLASFQSQECSEMSVLRLLPEEVQCFEQWGNGATAGLSECHSWRPSPQISRTWPKMSSILGH